MNASKPMPRNLWRDAVAGIAAVVAGLLLGGFTFVFILRFNDYFPAMLGAIPVVGPWLKVLLAAIAAFVAFMIAASTVWQQLESSKRTT